jgi:transcriptional regulator with XRE-family HTH domain
MTGDARARPLPRAAGELLRHWRTRRKMSQLDLALEADVSARHLSFIETGRAAPSREMLLLLAAVLDLPLRERNLLLHAAGYAAAYRHTDLAAPEMADARRALELILAHHDPNPAIVLDRRWNVLLANRSAAILSRFVADPAALATTGPPNAARFVAHPAGMRPFIVNWEEIVSHLVERLRREASFGMGDRDAADLLAEVLSYPAVPSRLKAPSHEGADVPLLSLMLSRDDETYSFLTTITTFGTAQDVTLQELRIETYFPADTATRLRMNGSLAARL